MNQEVSLNYCEHFQNFKSTKKVTIEEKPFCKFCMVGNCPLWLCLQKNCGVIVCGKSNHLHLSSHLEQSKKTKSFHSIYINIFTSEIRCQYCNIQILDLQQLNEEQKKKINLNGDSNNPLKFRFAILPYLQQLGQPKIMGQLQYPEGHRRINKGLVGILADRHNYSVIPAIQFIAHCDFFKQIILSMKLIQNGNKTLPLLKQLINIVKNIQEAFSRATRIEKFMQLLIKLQPKLMGYKRKDPFESLLDFLNMLHQYLNFYKVTNVLSNFGKDQWDLFYKSKQISSHCPIYDSLTSILSLNYKCIECNYQEQFNHQINFLKLQFPKKKRKNKIVQQQLNDKGYQSPRKRGKSLMSFIMPEQEIPITIPELLIQFLRQPFHKEKFCSQCKNKQIPMKAGKTTFKKLADILILQINRFPKQTDQLINTEVLLNYEHMDLSPFLQNNKKQKDTNKIKQNLQQKDQHQYEFCTAVGIEKGVFPIVCRSKYNNQLYIIKNESVQMLSKKTLINPYFICLKKKTSQRAEQFYQQILNQNQILLNASSIESQNKNIQSIQTYRDKMPLPDFYLIQLKYGIELPVFQPAVCKHSKLKPNIERKCKQQVFITQKMYEHLIQTFKGTLFVNQTCFQCLQQIQLVNQRKTKQKQLVKEYDQYKTSANVMVSMGWLKKWSNYLYCNQNPSYFHKGYPLPPPIDNGILLQNNKCKASLVKNKDFKIVNIFVFKLLKQLYTGGPQIRYKWKSAQLSTVDQSKIRQIRIQAVELKQIYGIAQPESPKRSVILQRSSSYMQTVNESEIEQDLQLQAKH